MLKSFLSRIKDQRRNQGKRYALVHILLFAILAILSGATSYRKLHKFIIAHDDTLNELFDLNWSRRPAHTTIRHIMQGTSGTALAQSFRAYSKELVNNETGKMFIAGDGKVWRGSFDHFQDQPAGQILRAFWHDGQLILAHAEIAAKTNEIPTAQRLMTAWGLAGYIYPVDALHCPEPTRCTAPESGNEVIVPVKKTNRPCCMIAKPSRPLSPPMKSFRNR